MHTLATSDSSCRFKGWLHRPFIDLGPASNVLQTHYHAAVIYAYKRLAETRPYPRLHGRINASTREAMVREADQLDYLVEDPCDVPKAVRTPQWSLLCEYLQGWRDLDAGRQLDVLWLLNRMGLFSAIFKYAVTERSSAGLADEFQAGHMLMRGVAALAFYADGAMALDVRELELVAAEAPCGSWAATEATYLLAQTNLRFRGDVHGGAYWVARHKSNVDETSSDSHNRCMLLSRYFRLRAFIPQLEKKFEQMTADMAQAAEYAGQMDKGTPETLAEWYMLTAACMESRLKEALLLGDLELAEHRARLLVNHTPSDARSWLELGQVLVEVGKVGEALNAYRAAARFGPPGTEVARFMAGQCYETLDQLDLAADEYVAALAIDPQAVSAIERLREIAPKVQGGSELADWSRLRAAALDDTPPSIAPCEEKALAYQQYDGVLGNAARANA
jgi:hypothetical protein